MQSQCAEEAGDQGFGLICPVHDSTWMQKKQNLHLAHFGMLLLVKT